MADPAENAPSAEQSPAPAGAGDESAAPSPARSHGKPRRRRQPLPGPTEERLDAAAARWEIPDIDRALLRRALLHASAVPPHSTDSNERLEFLGDSILNAAVAEALYREYPRYTEGDLAKGRSLVVSKLSLYEAGLRLGIGDLIVVGSNTEGALARSRRSLSADAVEALFAAVYLQYGWGRASAFVLRVLEPEMASVRHRSDLRDAKTILQERAQARKEASPLYRIVSEEGDLHSRTFTATVTLHGGVSGTGAGRSKKDAQQAAAAAALAQIAPDDLDADTA